ncbi:substrate-binding domain-containing protein [soil metagenome]
MQSEATPRPNLASVAALAGVSASTASIAFSGAGPVSDATREKVLAAAATLNYAGPDPRAASLRRGRSGIVGVVMDDRLSDAFRDPMNIAMLDGLADELGAAESGLLLMTGTTPFMTAPVDAIVLVGCSSRIVESVTVFRQRNLPIVAIEAEPMDGVLEIALDNRSASATLARHLRDLGHERVAVVTLPLDPARTRGPLTPGLEAASDVFTASERLRGVREVYPGASGVATSASLVEEGHAAALALLRARDRPTAIIAQSDLLAVGVIAAALELGLRVPEELSVVGFDGVPLDGIAPHDLTTMVQPAVEKGRAAGRAALALLAGEPATSAEFVSTFHRGATTAPAR